jgi:hypothetical protein
LLKVAAAIACRRRRGYDCRIDPSRKEGCVTFFRHHRQRGPVEALQMRLQG